MSLFSAEKKHLEQEKPLSMGSLQMERIFWSIPTIEFWMIHTDWLPGMHLAPLAQKIVRAGARLLSACSLVVRALAGPVIMSQLQYLV